MRLRSNTNKLAAFTLVELLVVISIILIASSIIFIGGSGGDGAKLSSSQRIVSGIAQGARGQAILKNAPTRLIIYSDNNPGGDPEKYLRYFGIVYYRENATDENGDPLPDGWLAATQGTYLPDGIYFDPDGGPSGGGNAWDGDTMTLDYPRTQVGSNTNRTNGGGSDEYYYYEFESNGTMDQDSQNGWLVLRAGLLQPSGEDLEVVFPDEAPSIADKENIKAALIFRRVGTTTMVSDPTDIN